MLRDLQTRSWACANRPMEHRSSFGATMRLEIVVRDDCPWLDTFREALSVNDNSSPESQRQLVSTIVTEVDDSTRAVLLDWATKLLEIRNSKLPAVVKARRALSASTNKEVFVSATELIYRKVKPFIRDVKRHGWDERGIAGRFTIGGIVLGATAFSGQGAGLAALGSAIGLPLWFVLGAGGAFLGTLVEELSRKGPSTTEYTEIEARRIERTDESTPE